MSLASTSTCHEMRVSEVRAEREHVARDGLAIAGAFFERSHRKRVAQVVNARPAFSRTRMDSDATNESKEGRNDRWVAQAGVPLGQEYGVVVASVVLASSEIRAEGAGGGDVHGHEATLAKLRLTNDEARGGDVVELERERLRDAQTRGGDETKQRHVCLRPKRAARAERCSGLEQRANVRPGEDERRASRRLGSERSRCRRSPLIACG